LRGAFSALLILIGALLTFPASIAVWEQRDLTDQDSFVSIGQEILEDPAVQDRLVERVQEDTLAVAAANGYTFPESGPGALGLNQVEALIRAVVMELPRSPIGERALIAAHNALLAVIDNESTTVEARNGEIFVNLRPVIEQVLNNFETILPNFPDLELPPGTGEIVVVQEEDVSLLFEAARWFDGAAWYIAAVPLICYVSAILVASNRQLALFLSGISLIAVAALRIVFYETGLRNFIVDNVVDENDFRAAARGIYDPIAASLVSQEMLVLVGGIVILAASIVWWGIKRTSSY
jgi:hypothetical protein